MKDLNALIQNSFIEQVDYIARPISTASTSLQNFLAPQSPGSCTFLPINMLEGISVFLLLDNARLFIFLSKISSGNNHHPLSRNF